VSFKRTKRSCPDCSKQCFCGNSAQLENNHIGGRNHASGISLPYCLTDHAQYHRNCEQAGVDFRKHNNPMLCTIQALKAHMVGMWMVVENLEGRIEQKSQGKK
jgi:hypothetical protein